MPPFNFGQTIARSLRQASENLSQTRDQVRERQLQRERQNALQRLRRQRLKLEADRVRKQRRQELLQNALDRRADRRQRRRTMVEVPVEKVPMAQGEGTVQVSPEVAASLLEDTRPKPGTVEVQRQNVSGLPGTGTVRMDADTLVRERGERNGQQAGDGDAPIPDTVKGLDKRIGELVKEEQRLLDEGRTDELGPVQDRIANLKRIRDALQRPQTDSTATNTTGADTTRTRGAAVSADTTDPATIGLAPLDSSRVEPYGREPGLQPYDPIPMTGPTGDTAGQEAHLMELMR
jgi:hypothetical protein